MEAALSWGTEPACQRDADHKLDIEASVRTAHTILHILYLVCSTLHPAHYTLYSRLTQNCLCAVFSTTWILALLIRQSTINNRAQNIAKDVLKAKNFWLLDGNILAEQMLFPLTICHELAYIVLKVEVCPDLFE